MGSISKESGKNQRSIQGSAQDKSSWLIQYLSEELHKKLFPKTKSTDYLKLKNPALLELAKEHLRYNELLGKKTEIVEPINIDNFPDFGGEKHPTRNIFIE